MTSPCASVPHDGGSTHPRSWPRRRPASGPPYADWSPPRPPLAWCAACRTRPSGPASLERCTPPCWCWTQGRPSASAGHGPTVGHEVPSPPSAGGIAPTDHTRSTGWCRAAMPRRECLGCRRLTTDTRCPTCAAARETSRAAPRGTATQRGYDSRWRRLVALAMAAQEAAQGVAYCVDCGVTRQEGRETRNPLTGDHLRWPALTIADVEIVCRRCNSARPARRRSRKA